MKRFKTIINENQRGFLFKNGRYAHMLAPGKYYVFGGKSIEKADISQPLSDIGSCPLDTLLADGAVMENASVIEVGDEQIALHYVNGRFSSLLGKGRHAFWKINDTHEYKIIDISSPYVDESVPKYIFDEIPEEYYIRAEVEEYEKALLYFDGKFQKMLEPGTYYFWKNNVKVDISYADTRLKQINITGQEILTSDKVWLRVNFVCKYRVTDYFKAVNEIDDYEEQIHVAAQLAMRKYVGMYKIDEILANKDGMSDYIIENLKEKEQELHVEITDAGVKDVILPGDVRNIMNTVLLAEKKAQANVITRREETASTRSLLNTAKLMDENKTLYKLKELEYIEHICSNVGNININGNSDLLSQLADIIGSRK